MTVTNAALHGSVLRAHFSFQGYAPKAGAELSDDILETAQTFILHPQQCMRLPCSVVATLAHIPTAMWKGFLLSAPHLPRYLLLFVWFLIAILSGVRQDLDCSLDSSFPNEPKEVGFSVIY